jgi:hypothetical protein
MATERITVVPPGSPPQELPPGPRRRHRLRGLRRRIASSRVLPWTIAAVFLATTLAALWLLHDAQRDDARSTAVQSTTRDFLTALTTFSATTIDSDVSRIRSYAVGDFATQVQQTFSDARIAQIKSSKVVSQGQVQSVFPENVTGSQATVFGVVNETVSNGSAQNPRSEVMRVEVGLIDTPGGWKVNSVNILQSPGATSVPTG